MELSAGISQVTTKSSLQALPALLHVSLRQQAYKTRSQLHSDKLIARCIS